ncbi:MAG TPA: hypothetical protein VHX49_01560 [Candidatus Acidoferrales bacterium]|jgi:hypothetical protein|nr:hypothetical protein [Candidatus Acidoferrales bacterium]
MSNDLAYLTGSERSLPMPSEYYLGNVRSGGTMRPTWAWLALAVVVLCGAANSAAAQNASGGLNVDESKMRFHLVPRTFLELPFVNSTQKPISGKFTLSLLNLEDDSSAAAISGTFIEPPGSVTER